MLSSIAVPPDLSLAVLRVQDAPTRSLVAAISIASLLPSPSICMSLTGRGKWQASCPMVGSGFASLAAIWLIDPNGNCKVTEE